MHTQFSIGNFYGIDSLIELITFGVSLIIFYYSRRIYHIIKEENYKFLSFGFLSLAAAFFFKIISNLTVLYKIELTEINLVNFVVEKFEMMNTINFVSFTLYKIFYLAGFLLLFFMVADIKNKEKEILFFYLGFITILFSMYFNFIFHMTIVVILIFITIHFYENYKKVKTQNSYLVFLAFLIISFSHLFLIFLGVQPLFYLFGELLILAGFSFLLINQIKIKNEQKKNKAGSIAGHIRIIKKG
jgi:hypothetical protein